MTRSLEEDFKLSDGHITGTRSVRFCQSQGQTLTANESRCGLDMSSLVEVSTYCKHLLVFAYHVLAFSAFGRSMEALGEGSSTREPRKGPGSLQRHRQFALTGASGLLPQGTTSFSHLSSRPARDYRVMDAPVRTPRTGHENLTSGTPRAAGGRTFTYPLFLPE